MIIFNALQTGMNGGIGRYSYELAKELYKLEPNNIKVVVRREEVKKFRFINLNDLIIVDGINNSIKRNYYEQFKLPKLIYKKYPNAIIHYPDSMAPLLSKNKVVITIHDLAFKTLKDAFTWKSKLWKNLATNLSIKKSDLIISISEFTKSEILKHYQGIDKTKIVVVHNGFNNFSNEEIVEENINSNIKKMENYILTVSTISPRKNIDGLIKAFYKIKDDVNYKLVVAGSNGWMYKKIYDLVEKLKLKDKVIFTGKVNDDELKYLYKNAKIFVYISFYEGFGLPPLEAMSYNVKCLVSNVSSIPEVVGDFAIKIDPNDINEISNKMLNLLNISYDVNKLDMEKHLGKFTWKICSINTLNSYKLIK